MNPIAVAELRVALRANANDLLAYLERRVSDREDAADLLGETMMTAWRRLDGLPDGDSTRQRMWLFGIASRTLGNHHRGRRRYAALVERLRSEMMVMPSATRDHAETTAVRDAVNRLRPDQRELITLVHWDGMTLNEAAQFLNLNPSTARSRYATARAALREVLDDHGPPAKQDTEVASVDR